MFAAAFMSRSCDVPQPEHVPVRMGSCIDSAHLPQAEHALDDGRWPAAECRGNDEPPGQA